MELNVKSLCSSGVIRKIKQWEVEGARAAVPHSWRRQCIQGATLSPIYECPGSKRKISRRLRKNRYITILWSYHYSAVQSFSKCSHPTWSR